MRAIFPNGIDDFGLRQTRDEYNTGVTASQPFARERIAHILRELEKHALELRRTLDATIEQINMLSKSADEQITALKRNIELGGAVEAGSNMTKQGKVLSLVATPAVEKLQVALWIDSAEYRANGTQVLSSRITGWEIPSGVAERTTFDTESATLVEVARRLKALIDDLMQHGLIGT